MEAGRGNLNIVKYYTFLAERQRRRRARLGMEQKEQEREDSRLRMQKRRALLAGGVLRFGDLSDQEDLGSDVKEGDKIDLEVRFKYSKGAFYCLAERKKTGRLWL